MSRLFHSTAVLVRQILRYGRFNSLEKLEQVAGPEWAGALVYYEGHGGVIKVGQIESIEILTRGLMNPVHQSSYNRKDKEWVISARIKPEKGDPATHHIYIDGTGTIKMGGPRN